MFVIKRGQSDEACTASHRSHMILLFLLDACIKQRERERERERETVMLSCAEASSHTVLCQFSFHFYPW
jgi:hypothetical protein